jgi:hypothetical protein
MSLEQASSFIEGIEKGLGSSKNVANDYSDIMPEELTIQDKLDTINHSYKHLVSGYNAQLSGCQDILKYAIDFYADEMQLLKTSRPQSSDFEEIASRQRTLSYNAQSLFRLVQLYYEMSGAKTHVNHHAAIGKLYSNGFITMHKDALTQYLPNE